MEERAAKRNIQIVEAPRGCRDVFVDPYFERAKPNAVVVILKAREPARIMAPVEIEPFDEGEAWALWTRRSRAAGPGLQPGSLPQSPADDLLAETSKPL
jgi:hypothetical protein